MKISDAKNLLSVREASVARAQGAVAKISAQIFAKNSEIAAFREEILRLDPKKSGEFLDFARDFAKKIAIQSEIAAKNSEILALENEKILANERLKTAVISREKAKILYENLLSAKNSAQKLASQKFIDEMAGARVKNT